MLALEPEGRAYDDDCDCILDSSKQAVAAESSENKSSRRDSYAIVMHLSAIVAVVAVVIVTVAVVAGVVVVADRCTNIA